MIEKEMFFSQYKSLYVFWHVTCEFFLLQIRVELIDNNINNILSVGDTFNNRSIQKYCIKNKLKN